MNRSNASAALAIATVLTLTGCGGSAPSGTTASASPSPASSDPTPTPTPKAYTNEELTAIVAGLKDAQGQPLTVVPAAQIDQGLIAAREMLKTAVITPKSCGVLIDNNTQVPEGSTYAAGGSLAAKAKTATVVTVFAVKDPAVMTTQFNKSATALSDCSSYTVELKGQKITSEMKTHRGLCGSRQVRERPDDPDPPHRPETGHGHGQRRQGHTGSLRGENRCRRSRDRGLGTGTGHPCQRRPRRWLTTRERCPSPSNPGGQRPDHYP
jgi:hypothetical protein